MFECLLPIPPSVNHAYQFTRNGNYKSSAYKRWWVEAQTAFNIQHEEINTMTGRLSVEYLISFGDKRKRDIDNYLKATTDFLEAMEVFENDNQIDDIHVKRMNGEVEFTGVWVSVREI